MTNFAKDPNLFRVLSDYEKRINALERLSGRANAYGTHFGTQLLLTSPAAQHLYFPDLIWFAKIWIPNYCVITGVSYRVGGTSSGNVGSAIYNSSGERLAYRNTLVAQAAINTNQQVAFDTGTPLTVTPGVHHIGLTFSSGSATAVMAHLASPSYTASATSSIPPSSITPPSTIGNMILQATY